VLEWSLFVANGQSYPKPINAAKHAINDFAERLAAQFSFAPGDPIEPLVRRLGGHVVVKNPVAFTGQKPESIIVRSASDFTIFVPGMTSIERDRFTIAHELGHLFLHFPAFSQANPGVDMVATRWVDESDKDQQRAEWEANWFAAGFIMPSSAFKAVYGETGGDVRALAVRFGVSQSAAEIRAKTFGLV